MKAEEYDTERTVFKAVLNKEQAERFRRTLSAVYDLSDDAQIIVREKGLEIVTLDDQKIVLVRAELDRDFFTEYHFADATNQVYPDPRRLIIMSGCSKCSQRKEQFFTIWLKDFIEVYPKGKGLELIVTHNDKHPKRLIAKFGRTDAPSSIILIDLPECADDKLFKMRLSPMDSPGLEVEIEDPVIIRRLVYAARDRKTNLYSQTLVINYEDEELEFLIIDDKHSYYKQSMSLSLKGLKKRKSYLPDDRKVKAMIAPRTIYKPLRYASTRTKFMFKEINLKIMGRKPVVLEMILEQAKGKSKVTFTIAPRLPDW